MSTLVDLLPSVAADSFDGDAVVARAESMPETGGDWDPHSFAEEQLRSLVRQIFLPASGKPARQVVFSPIDHGTGIKSVAPRVAEMLAQQSQRPTCVVELNGKVGDLPADPAHSRNHNRFGTLRDSCHQLTENLWRMPEETFGFEFRGGFSAAWLRGRLAELRLEFEYSLFEVDPIAIKSQAMVLGSLCDGVILVVEENSTRRSVAVAARQKLAGANARLIGAILAERSFAIPQALYKRL